MCKFYVYGLIDPRTNTIKYIGKGSGDRMFKHIKSAKRNKVDSNNYTKFNALKEILKDFDDVGYEILYRTDNEAQAYAVETEMIKKYQTLKEFGGWNLVEKTIPPSNKGKKFSPQA